MNKKIIFIADFFSDEIAGGGELNNDEVILILSLDGYEIIKKNSRDCNLEFIKNHKDDFFIIANFVQLHSSCLNYIQEKCRYIIYEHDHKYLKTRNPADYENYIAPKTDIVNEIFYKKAIAVLAQSIFHKDIILKNISNVNVVNLSGNIWKLETFNLLERYSKKDKKDFCAIMNTNNWHKNTDGAIKYCKQKNYSIDIIEPCEYDLFLDKISENKKFVFFPKTAETLSRVVVESRMMGMTVITNEKVGATYEEWFKLKGKELIEEMKSRRQTIPNIIKGYL